MPNPISDEQRAWELTCSLAITSDVIWKLDAYRAALFLLHVARGDCKAMRAAHPDDQVAPQLLSAAASVSAHVGEGYSRGTRADRPDRIAAERRRWAESIRALRDARRSLTLFAQPNNTSEFHAAHRTRPASRRAVRAPPPARQALAHGNCLAPNCIRPVANPP
jgi:hypothetical protein